MIFAEIKAQDLSYTTPMGAIASTVTNLTDTDWMDYKLITKFTTKKYGNFI